MSTELINRLEQQLGATREQAEGGAGLLLQLAQQKIPANDFLKVADAIPAISDLIGKSPLVGTPHSNRLLIWLSRLFGGLGGMAELVDPFEKLGMTKSMIPKFVGFVLSYFSEKGGQEVESLLLQVLR
jgi:hypothetical protein